MFFYQNSQHTVRSIYVLSLIKIGSANYILYAFEIENKNVFKGLHFSSISVKFVENIFHAELKNLGP